MPITTDPPYVEDEINGQKVQVLLDTGDDSSIIAERMANKLNLKFFGASNALSCVPTIITNSFLVELQTESCEINPTDPTVWRLRHVMA